MIPERFSAWLTINRACNLRCGWCYARSTEFLPQESMALDLARDLLGFLRGLPVRRVVVIGGEPTIHPNFFDIIAMIKEVGLDPLLVTNGVMFKDKAFLKEAIEAGLMSLAVSLKAGSREAYLKSTGKDVFPYIMEAVHNINESGISNKISLTLCGEMFDSFEDILRAISDSGAQLFSVDTERPVILNDKTQAVSAVSPGDMVRFMVDVYPRIAETGVKHSLKISLPFCLYPLDFIERLIKEEKIEAGCQLMKGSGIILDPMGNLLPCNQFCENPLGKFGEDFFSGEEYVFFRKREDVKSFYGSMMACPHQKCVHCKLWKYCGGGCRINWLHYGAEALLNL